MNRKEFREFLNARNYDSPFTLRDFAGFAPKALVANETLPLVAMLEKKLGLTGYRTIAGLNSQITIPVQKSRLSVGKKGVNEASDDSNAGVEALTLAPVKFTASTVIGKEMLVASNSDVEAFIVDSLTRELAYEVENYMLQKVAEGAEKEINYSALNAFTWQDALAFEAAVDGYNVDNASFVMSTSARATLKGIEKAENTAKFICENNEINGYAVNVSGCAKDDNIYYGAWDRLILAQFG
jgi:HK97 family phage major capsid protein